RRPHDGQQPALLQLQVDQPEEERAVHGAARDRALDRAARLAAAARAVPRLRRLRGVRVRGVRVALVALVARAALPGSAAVLSAVGAAATLLLARRGGFG